MSHEHANAESVKSGIETVEHLAEHLDEVLAPTSVVVCIGNELCGDDGAGVLIARELAGKIPWQVFNTQTVPESFLMKIANRKPETVLLVDALDFDASPGAVEVIEAEGVGGQGPSTHGPAPIAFLEVLRMIHSCRCAVLGIQPQRTNFGDDMTQPVVEAVNMVCRAFEQLAAAKGAEPPL